MDQWDVLIYSFSVWFLMHRSDSTWRCGIMRPAVNAVFRKIKQRDAFRYEVGLFLPLSEALNGSEHLLKHSHILWHSVPACWGEITGVVEFISQLQPYKTHTHWKKPTCSPISWWTLPLGTSSHTTPQSGLSASLQGIMNTHINIIYRKCCVQRAKVFIKDTFHPNPGLFTLLA